MKLLILLSVLGLPILQLDGARILGIFHVSSYSHQVVPQKIMKELALRGHKVTVVTPIKIKNPVPSMKIIELPLEFISEEESQDLIKEESLDFISSMLLFNEFGLMHTEKFLKQMQENKILEQLNEQYDLVIIEQFLNEAFRGFCYHFKAPCVLISAVGASRFTNYQTGNPSSPAFVPDILSSYSTKMTFWERSWNSIYYLTNQLYFHLQILPDQNKLLHKYFPEAPHLEELYYNASLILLTSHVSTQAAVPLVQNMIEVGGLHVNPPKKLPHHLQKYLDDAKEGVIYFSVGSHLKSKDLPIETRVAILRSFAKLKQKILWKWENETLPDQPSNVKLAKWVPQNDVLAHPNVKLFMTHGGLMSTIETIYNGVPIIGIPFFADQKMNIAHAKQSEFGLGIYFSALTEETLDKAINEILSNSKYSDNAKRLSRVMHDQPTTPLDRAIFWIEYVVRHKGAHHLRRPGLELAWYQFLLLDVVAAVFLIVLALSWILLKTYKLLCGKVVKLGSSSEIKKKIN